MWRFGSFLGLVLGMLVVACTPAAALTQSISDTITIAGIVPPAKYVYVDADQKIIKIISNCKSDAAITVLSESQPTQTLPLNDDIVRQYNLIKTGYDLNKIGTVYNYSSLQPKTPKNKSQPTPLSQLFQNSLALKF